MRDALGAHQSVVVIGGNSDIGLAVVRAVHGQGRLRSVVLLGRSDQSLDRARGALADLDGIAIRTDAGLDLLDVDAALAATDRAFADDDVDCVLVAAGLLETEVGAPDIAATTARVLGTNLVGVGAVLARVAERFAERGHGTIVVLSSVAAVRARSDNAAYSASKAGLDVLCDGLRHRLAGTGVDLLVVRPGFVHTQMTDGLTPAPFATTPDRVAADTVAAMVDRRTLIYSPGILRYLFAILGRLPAPIWRRLGDR